LVRLGRGLDIPFDERRTERGGYFLRKDGLTCAWLTFDQQRPTQLSGGVNRDLQVISGDIIIGAFKAHEQTP
jgi:hypothetical protein